MLSLKSLFAATDMTEGTPWKKIVQFSLPMLIGILAVLGGGTIFVAIVSFKAWKQSKAEYDAYMADLRAEAEAKRAAEEEEAAALEAEDEYYDALEAAEEKEN